MRVSVGCGAYGSDTRIVPSTGGDPNWLQWQCFNLGADTSLDPFTYVSKGVTVGYDIKGDLYQWGRPKDEHQIRTSATTTTLSNSNTPGHANFIISTSSPSDWLSGGSNTSRWGDGTTNENMAKAANDPCPAGWKVPSYKQWASIYTNTTATTPNTWTWTTSGYKVGDALFLPAAGSRGHGTASTVNGVGSSSYYWSSTVTSIYSYHLYFRSDSVLPAYSSNRAYGFSVRCVSE